jgi:toxin with endonuclease activity of toxin-antitoxin system
MGSEYLLKYHDFYYQRILALKEQVRRLKAGLTPEDFGQHEIVKFAARVRRADREIIPQDPNKTEYRLQGALRRYRRYKQGLQRYRLFFCFSNNPPVIVYLYLNDEKHLRKAKSKTDPYEQFSGFVSRGTFSHDPSDKKIQKWIRKIAT